MFSVLLSPGAKQTFEQKNWFVSRGGFGRFPKEVRLPAMAHN